MHPKFNILTINYQNKSNKIYKKSTCLNIFINTIINNNNNSKIRYVFMYLVINQ